MQVIPELKELNLEENEIKVYLACLILGTSKVKDISKRSELIRTTTYGVLKSLIEKGLISTIIINKITNYQAASPKQLIEILNEKKEVINAIIPRLENLQLAYSKKEHKVEFFEGRKGIKTIINDQLKKKGIILRVFGNFEKFKEFSETFADQYYRRRNEMKVHAKVILPDTPHNRKAKKLNKEHNRETRFINKDSSTEIYLYDNKVAFISFKENDLRGILIHDEELYEFQKMLFENSWKQAKL